MQKIGILLTLSMLLFSGRGLAAPPGGSVVTLGGLVKHPLRLTLEDLANYRSTSARLTEVERDGTFRGVHIYQGVPLQNLLQAAGVEKEGGAFHKAIDLAIGVRNRQGKRALLSWAEVAYGRPGDVLVAFSAESPMTRGGGSSENPPSLPTLVVANDFYSDRSLKDIVAIEVFDPIVGTDTEPVPFSAEKGGRPAEVATRIVWEGIRFEGVQRFSGTPLADVLRRAGVADDPRAAVLVRSKDGYRSLLSLGEIFWSPLGQRILLADRLDDPPVGGPGERWLVLPDSSANRFVRNVASIELIRPRHQPKLTVIGVGPGDTSLGQVLKAAEGETERFLGLIYLGPCLAEGGTACN